MSRRKTNETDESVDDFIDSIADERKRDDCRAIARIMSDATGMSPRMWGTSIIGFGKRHYRYADGKPAEICQGGFAPRARSFAFYLPKYPEHASLVAHLGKHRYHGGCLHLSKLADVDSSVLSRMVGAAFRMPDGATD